MALSYEFILNGETLDATIGSMVYDKLEEALDEAAFHLPITTYGFPKKILGLLEIKASEDSLEKKFNYLVISDEVNDTSKDGFYEHNLIAVEYTHKLDKTFVSALTFTKTFFNNSRAPFRYLKEDIVGGDYLVNSLFPKVEFRETYLTDEEVLIPQVDKAYAALGINNDAEVDVWIKSDIPNHTTDHNLTQSSVTYTMPDVSGNYEIEVGFYISGNRINVFRHYIRVLKERKYTLYDMIERLRSTVPIERESFLDSTRIFTIDPNLENLFKSIEMPQMFFRQQTARQVLNTIFKYVNAISRLNYVDNGEDILTVDFFNKTTTTFDDYDITNFSVSQNAQDYGTKAISFLTQVLQSNFRENPSVITPANNLYKTVRASGVQLTDSTYEIKLERPIYEISKLEVVLPFVAFRLDDTENGSSFFYKSKRNFVLDLTSRFLPKPFWDLKNKTVDIVTYPQENPFTENVGMRLNQGGNLFWEQNTKIIQTNFQVGSIVKNTLLQEVILEALNEELTLRAYDEELFNSTLNGTTQIDFLQDFPMYNPTIDIKGDLSSLDVLYRNLKFNIEYSTLDDTVIRQERLDTEFVDYNSDVRINNFQTINDYGRVSRDLYGKIERSALPNKKITKIHTGLSDVLDVGQIDADNYIITERKLIFHNEFIEGVYTLTRNHNRLNEFNGINQEYRAFEIPSFNESIKRMDFYSDYIYIVKPDQRGKIPFDATDTTIFDFESKPFEAFKHLNNSAFPDFQTKITYAFVRTDGFLDVFPDTATRYNAIMTPVVSFGGKNNLNFNFKFDNNQIAGDAITPSSLDGVITNTLKVTNYYNNPIRYTDEQGYFDKLWFGMSNRYEEPGSFTTIADESEEYFNDGYAYPLVRGPRLSLDQDFKVQNGTILNPDWFVVYKDPATTYGFSYQLNVIPLDYRAFVIGQNFYTENPMVVNSDGVITKYLYVYEDDTRYNIFDDLKIKSGYVTSIELNSNNLVTNEINYTIDFSGNAEFALEDATSWAIGDSEGNLYLACNENYKGFGLIARHRRLGTYEIGQKISYQLSEINDFITSDLNVNGFIIPVFNASAEDLLNSNLEILGTVQQTFDVPLSHVLYSSIYVEGEAQVTYDDSLSQILSASLLALGIAQITVTESMNHTLQADMIIDGSSQLTISDIMNHTLQADMIIDGSSEVTISGVVNQTLQADMIIDGSSQVTISNIVNHTLQANMIADGSGQVTDADSITETLNAFVLIEGFAQITRDGSITTSVLNSELTIEGFAQTTQDGFITTSVLNSELTIEGFAQTTISSTLGTLNIIDEISIEGFAQTTRNGSIPTSVLNSEIIMEGFAQTTRNGSITTNILNSELTIEGFAQTTQNGSIATEQLTNDIVIDGSLAYFRTLKAAISVSNDTSTPSRFLSTSLNYEFGSEGSSTMTLNNQYVNGYTSPPSYSTVGTRVEGTSYYLSVPSTITAGSSQWSFNFWSFVVGGSGNHSNPKTGTLDQDMTLLAVYTRIS